MAAGLVITGYCQSLWSLILSLPYQPSFVSAYAPVRATCCRGTYVREHMKGGGKTIPPLVSPCQAGCENRGLSSSILHYSFSVICCVNREHLELAQYSDYSFKLGSGRPRVRVLGCYGCLLGDLGRTRQGWYEDKMEKKRKKILSVSIRRTGG